MPQSPAVSAIILNYRTPQVTARCARELLQQTFIGQMEILVIDNHSEDDSVGVLRNTFRDEPRVRIVETPRNLGFGQGYEAGVRQARGTYILFNNPEKVLVPEGVERLVRTMEQDPSIGILAPKLVHRDGTVRLSPRHFPGILDLLAKRTVLGRLFPKRVARYLLLDLPQDVPHDVEWIAGGCFMIPAKLFRDLGGFDRRYYMFFEDVDLCRRAWQAGKRVVYDPRAQGQDRKRRLSEMNVFLMPFKKLGRMHIASGVKYFWKWRGA
ncbi:MAG: glycosyltransferase family 2 protein [Patescibacteria group bacterium]